MRITHSFPFPVFRPSLALFTFRTLRRFVLTVKAFHAIALLAAYLVRRLDLTPKPIRLACQVLVLSACVTWPCGLSSPLNVWPIWPSPFR